MKKILIINIEIKSREFISRMMIAYEALKREYDIVIGAQDQLLEILFNLPKGIYLEKSISKNKLKILKKIKKHGHKIVNLDEEGMASQNNSHFFLKQRLSKETLDLTEYFFNWGNNEKKLLQNKYFDSKDKFKTTGNPRIDSWKPKYSKLYKNEIEYINNKYENFIFITSNFASIQHARGSDFLKQQASDYRKIETVQDEEILNSKRVFMKKVYSSFLDMIKKLSLELPNNIIVLRPHPADDIDQWKKKLMNYKNVYIEYEFSATPWIISCKCMIHSSCTTGMEGFFSNTPVFSYLPYKDHSSVNYISNTLSDICLNYFELIKKVKSVLGERYNRDYKKIDVLKDKSIIENIDESNSAKKLIDLIEKINIEKYEKTKVKSIILFKIKNFLKKIIKSLIYKNEINDNYSHQKMPGIDKFEVLEKLERLQIIDGGYLNDKINVEEINKNVFLISKS
jgi:surface carbohydrate biosynthesis protein